MNKQPLMQSDLDIPITDHRPPAVWFPAVQAGSGTDVFTEQLAKGLRARGIYADITWLPHRAEYAPWTVPVPDVPSWANIVHVNSWLHSRFLPTRLPVVSTLHHCVHDSSLLPYKSQLQQFYHQHWIKHVETANLHRANQIVTVSQFTAEKAKKAFGIHDLDVIYNGVDIEEFHPIERSKPNKPFRLLYVGNWILRKGVDLLAPIMEQLGSRFTLIYTADRRNAHLKFKLPSNTYCIGKPRKSELIRLYQTSDALIFPSRLEGFGLVAAEAMACGLPVIAANSSALPEVVEDEVNGFLCPQDDISAFVFATQQLSQNPKLWKDLRQAAKQRAESRFSLHVMTKQYMALYRALIAH